MKNIILFIIFIFCIIFTSLIKNNTRSIEKKIILLKDDILLLRVKLNEAKLEHNYLTTPESIKILSSNYLEEDFSNYKKKNIENLNLFKGEQHISSLDLIKNEKEKKK